MKLLYKVVYFSYCGIMSEKGMDKTDKSEIVDLSDKSNRFLEVRIDITNQCNIRCRMCYFSLKEKSSERVFIMEPEKFRRIAEQVFPYSHVVLVSCGAEPLVHPHFDEILKIAKQYTGILGFSTNGQLLDRSMAELCVDLPVEIIIFSIDAASEENYSWIRRGGSLGKLLGNIKELNRLKGGNGESFPRLKGNIVLMKKNIRELPEIVKLASEYGFIELNAEFMRIYDGLNMEEQSLQDEPDLAHKYIEEARKIAEDLGIALYAPSVMSEGNPGFKSICQRPWNFINIWPSGEVIPCDGWRGGPPLGNLFHTDFEKIWNGMSYRILRRSLLTGKGLNFPCASCNAFLSKETSPEVFKENSYTSYFTDFTAAASEGRFDRVLELLEEGHHVDERNKLGETTLMKAATEGNVEVMVKLIEKGADVNRESFKGVTPLIAATLNNRVKAVEFLLNNDASVDMQNEAGISALMIACERGLTEVVKMLLAHGADVNLRNEKGGSALMAASKANNSLIAGMLIEKGADIHMKNKKGMTALLFAKKRNSDLVAKLLVNKGARASL